MADMIFGVGQRIVPGFGIGSALPSIGAGEETSGPSFSDTLKKAIEDISAAQDNADATVQAYLRGEPVELHQVMAASEEAGIALELLVELRNKLTEAYRTIVNMQS